MFENIAGKQCFRSNFSFSAQGLVQHIIEETVWIWSDQIIQPLAAFFSDNSIKFSYQTWWLNPLALVFVMFKMEGKLK